MSKSLICPMGFARHTSQPCIEENCAWWIPKGTTDKKIGGVDNSMTIYEPVGCCVVRLLGKI